MLPNFAFNASLSRLRTRFEEIKRESLQIELERSPRFSALAPLRPNEVGLSRLLAYFLDPCESHGQGATFLNQFLSLVNCAPVENRAVRVSTEVLTEHGRRIDIVVDVGDHHIGIENKPWAAESQSQCADYANELERLAPGEWTLVFLTADGRSPCSAGDFATRVKALGYEKLFLISAHSPRVQSFLDDFFEYIRVKVMGEPEMPTPADQYTIECLLQPENMEVTLQVLTHAAVIRQLIITRFADALLKRLQDDIGPDWQLERQLNWQRRYAGIYYYRSSWKGLYGIGFSNMKDRGTDVRFGVWCWGAHCGAKAAILREKLQDPLNQSVRKVGSGTEHWLWQVPLEALGLTEYMNWHSAEIQDRLALQEGRRAIDDLYPLLTGVIKAARPLLDAALGQEEPPPTPNPGSVESQ